MSRSPLFYLVIGVLSALAAILWTMEGRPFAPVVIYALWSASCLICALVLWWKERHPDKKVENSDSL